MNHLTMEVLGESWTGRYADLLAALDDLGADQNLDGFRAQGLIWVPLGDLHDDTPVFVSPCARYFRDGKRQPLAQALRQRDNGHIA